MQRPCPMTGSLSWAMNICSVRQSPIPLLRNLSLFLHLPVYLHLPRPQVLRSCPPFSAIAEVFVKLRFHEFDFSEYDFSLCAVYCNKIILFTVSPTVKFSAARLILMLSAGDTRFPKSLATTAAWLVMPPCAVTTPWAAKRPCMSSGVVSDGQV